MVNIYDDNFPGNPNRVCGYKPSEWKAMSDEEREAAQEEFFQKYSKEAREYIREVQDFQKRSRNSNLHFGVGLESIA